ncbi:MAG: hypothetical protein ACTSWT_12845 [Candidatus Heimdallarchaeota archaeon]
MQFQKKKERALKKVWEEEKERGKKRANERTVSLAQQETTWKTAQAAAATSNSATR